MKSWGLCLKSPETFRVTILFASPKLRRLEALNFAVILISILFTTYKKTGFTEEVGRSFTNGFSGPKSFQHFRETDPGSFNIFQIQGKAK